MGMHCDLHAIDHDLRTEVRVRGNGPCTPNGKPFVVVELSVGDAYATLFLGPDQALDLAHGISSALQAADMAGSPAAEAIGDKGGAL